MTIVSIETAMKYSFITKTDIPKKKIWILLQYTKCPSTKLNSQSAIILTQFQIDVVRMVLLRIITFCEP